MGVRSRMGSLALTVLVRDAFLAAAGFAPDAHAQGGDPGSSVQLFPSLLTLFPRAKLKLTAKLEAIDHLTRARERECPHPFRRSRARQPTSSVWLLEVSPQTGMPPSIPTFGGRLQVAIPGHVEPLPAHQASIPTFPGPFPDVVVYGVWRDTSKRECLIHSDGSRYPSRPHSWPCRSAVRASSTTSSGLDAQPRTRGFSNPLVGFEKFLRRGAR